MTTVSAVDRIRLAALLGMLGSTHVGERENAAKLVEQFRQKHGLTWTDLLARPSLSKDPYEPAGERPFNPHFVHAAAMPPTYAASGAREVVWRWSMLAGLGVVGLISFTTLIQQHAAVSMNRLPPSGDAQLASAAQDRPDSVPTPPVHPTIGTNPSAVPAGARQVLMPFPQGAADRKLSDNWFKAVPPGLCSGHFTADQSELKAACAAAQKLLAQFEQRRRVDPEYRRGWNSPTS